MGENFNFGCTIPMSPRHTHTHTHTQLHKHQSLQQQKNIKTPKLWENADVQNLQTMADKHKLRLCSCVWTCCMCTDLCEQRPCVRATKLFHRLLFAVIPCYFSLLCPRGIRNQSGGQGFLFYFMSRHINVALHFLSVNKSFLAAVCKHILASCPL